MAAFNAFGIVLRYADYGESSRMLTILTPELGKIDAAVHGCRKIGAKLAPCVQIFSYGGIRFRPEGRTGLP